MVNTYSNNHLDVQKWLFTSSNYYHQVFKWCFHVFWHEIWGIHKNININVKQIWFVFWKISYTMMVIDLDFARSNIWRLFSCVGNFFFFNLEKSLHIICIKLFIVMFTGGLAIIQIYRCYIYVTFSFIFAKLHLQKILQSV